MRMHKCFGTKKTAYVRLKNLPLRAGGEGAQTHQKPAVRRSEPVLPPAPPPSHPTASYRCTSGSVTRHVSRTRSRVSGSPSRA